MAADLHLHSTASDGSDSPGRIVQLAVEAGLSTIALTAHDNLDGIVEAQEVAEQLSINLISGTELSVQWEGGAMHLLVYFLEPGSGPLQDRLGWLQASRHERNLEIVERFNALGIAMTYEEVAAEADGRGVGRPHFAAVLMAGGHVKTIAEAFERYLATGGLAYRPRRRLDALEAIELARESGAVPVIAHPHTLGVGRRDYDHAFEALAAVGLGGIEALYSDYTPEARAHLVDVCNTLGLVATGGSDYHGRYKPALSVGIGKGDLHVPDEVVIALRQQATAV